MTNRHVVQHFEMKNHLILIAGFFLVKCALQPRLGEEEAQLFIRIFFSSTENA